MCGIAGVFGVGSVSPKDATLAKMVSKIAHRGPDGQGTILFPDAGLAHVRLAIIDLDGGKQPMSTDDNHFHITYNGELYNFKEVKKRLESDGVLLKTLSDTEVVLKAWQRYGSEILLTFRGMFAFALWDSKNRRGYLIRDRFGVKPLYWTRVGKQVVFGSEIKSILPVLPGFPGLNKNSLNLLMNFRYIPGNETMFNTISQIPPGCFLEWNQDKVEIKKWAPRFKKNRQPDILKIRELLQQAVNRQLVSDVQVGAYLSGGIDSATIVSLASRCQKQFTLPTFTIQVGDSIHEAQNARNTAKHFKLSNFQEPIQETLSTTISNLIYHLEVPKVNAWQSSLVSRLASKHVKVALSGLGGDELFLGYNIHSMMAGLAKLSSPVGKAASYLGEHVQPLFRPLGLQFEEFQRAGQVLEAYPDYAVMYGIIRNVWDSENNRKRIYGPSMLNEESENAFQILKTKWHDTQDPVMAAACFEMENKMVNDLLLQEDRLSMAFGLEVRVPFLDENLVDYVWPIDRLKKMKGGQKKSLLRTAVSPWIPAEILKRPKSGFQVPVHKFFNKHLRPLCTQYLNRERLLQDGIFNPSFVEDVLACNVHHRLRWHYFLLYLMIGVTIWLDIFRDGTEVPEWH